MVAAMVTTIALALPAGAVTPSSSVEAAPTTVAPGQTFTVTQTIHNPETFTVTAAKAAIYGEEVAITAVADLVSCTGTIAPCGQLGSSYRGGVGDLPGGESRTVVFTLVVRADAPAGPFTLQHQHVGDNFAFEVLDGPVITVDTVEADLAVSIQGNPNPGLLSVRVDYTIRVTNNGPDNATNIRVTANYAAGLGYDGSSQCSRVSGTRTVHCDIPALAAGASATARFSTDAGLLALGPFTTTAHRTSSTPNDPNSANDTSAETCTALTALIVTC